MKYILITMFVFLVASQVSAQDNPKWPTAVFSAAAIADGVSTYKFLSDGSEMKENNPMVAWMGRKPIAVVVTGVAVETTAVLLWNRYVGRNHPKLAKWGLLVGAGVHGALTVNNIRINRQELRKRGL
jgi:hypothetical protein